MSPGESPTPVPPDREAIPARAGRGPHPHRPTGPGTVELAKINADTERARIEAERAERLAKIDADKAAQLAKIAADDAPPPEAPSTTIRSLGFMAVGVILALCVALSILYNVPFKGNPFTGDVTVGAQPTVTTDPAGGS
jgi:hypothetical protein